MQEESLYNCITPSFRTIPVSLTNLSRIDYGISNYEYGDFNFYSFRTYGKIISYDEKATVPVFVLSCLFDENITMECVYTILQAKEKCGKLQVGDILTVTGKLGTSKNKRNRINLSSLFVEDTNPTHVRDLKAMVTEEIRFCRNFHEYIYKYLEVQDSDSSGLLRRITYEPKQSDNKSPMTGGIHSSSFAGYESVFSTPAISRATTMTPLNIPSSTPRSRHIHSTIGVKRPKNLLFETPSTYSKPPLVKKSKENYVDIMNDSEPMNHYVLTIVQSAKDVVVMNGNPWNGITLSDILIQSLSPEEKVKQSIVNLTMKGKLRLIGMLTYDIA